MDRNAISRGAGSPKGPPASEPWPQAGKKGVAQPSANQRRKIAGQEITTPTPGGAGVHNLLKHPDFTSSIAAAFPKLADAQGAQFTARVSFLLAGVQRADEVGHVWSYRSAGTGTVERKEFAGSFNQLGRHTETQTATLKIWFEACEAVAANQRNARRSPAELSKILHEALVFVAGVVIEVQPQGQSQGGGVRHEQKNAGRVGHWEPSAPTIEQFLQRLEKMEETAVAVGLPQRKNRLNNRRRRKLWLRKQREMSMEATDTESAEYNISTTPQRFDSESEVSFGSSRSSNEGQCTIGLRGRDITSVCPHRSAAFAQTQILIAL